MVGFVHVKEKPKKTAKEVEIILLYVVYGQGELAAIKIRNQTHSEFSTKLAQPSISQFVERRTVELQQSLGRWYESGSTERLAEWCASFT
ncbi:unnamed protein product [Angiostrongylus costaricensis]|uniref:HTH_48 domain-containing protein n=1 Tax=Angiostrongylus costaricensis TaxID=334426 RepID=A0A0R3Q2W7_ANGCS|nr:unnamed protein product [Angiostrongylus costaricensis]